MNPALDSLAAIASNSAMEAAAAYIRARGLKDGIDFKIDTLIEALRRHSKTALDLAMRDAREALACGMQDVAVATFTATFKLAGIEAAKEACGH